MNFSVELLTQANELRIFLFWVFLVGAYAWPLIMHAAIAGYIIVSADVNDVRSQWASLVVPCKVWRNDAAAEQ